MSPEPQLPRARRALAAFAICLLLSVIHTWPLASAPATLSRNDNKDTVLNTWAITWVAHALVTAPSRVLAGNIFHPERNTIAFSDPVIIPGALSVPVRAAGAGPVLTYNLSLLLGYALSAWSMWWLAWRWTGRFWPALVAASLYAFNAHSLVSMGHIQAIHAYGLPLLLVALDALGDPQERRWWHGALAGVATALLALTSGYLAIFGIVCGLIVLVVRLRGWLQPPWRPLVAGAVVGSVLLALPVVPVMHAYREMQATHGFERSLDLVAAMSANGAAYMATPARVHEAWARHVYQTREPRDSLFPGVAAVLLALAALGWRSPRAMDAAGRPARAADGTDAVPAWRHPHVRIAMGLVAVGLVLSFGPATPVYRAFYHLVPFASGVRAASRFGVLLLTGLAILAAFGVAAMARRWPQRAGVLAGLALVAVNVEAFRGPVPYVPAAPISSVYAVLATRPDGVVAEMPFWWRGIDVPRNANYMLDSTTHWKPLLNGYSGFTPESYRRRADVLWYFPFRSASFDELDRAGVRYLVLHLAEYGSQRREARDLIDASGRWRAIARDETTVLYERVP
ncbi:hypothetical protein TBR22_A22320 [Luteitalea sp. TBR-22]|uniref:hypothetical protein n=1 Tax=Luteitalea sp. TBR-22 TaxID=2802971 RepID=UPI001AFA2EFC|nr:hypothetical protein [Luteitalea sp. TBR-22]BCS33007.1 hypothetical protein TBR22_A22320 [Luteitalea sp. TBR-22]